MTLLFITQKLHGQDSFGLLWIKAFVKKGYKVKVICLEDRHEDDGNGITVYSLGKERGKGKLSQILRFWKLIMSLQYDRVFIHMSPVWYALGWWCWLLTFKPCYLWYTHYKMQLGVRLFGWFGKRFFCATSQSLPQYEGSPKKIVTGHGIDLSFWPQRANTCLNPKRLIVVHRLSRSKRLEIVLQAMMLLPQYSLDIYGIEAEPDYAAEMKALTRELGLDDRIVFHGTVPMTALPGIYTQHKLILNMASETIDKTMLEAMTCGCYPVTTRRNAAAIGISEAPGQDTPEAVAAFVEKYHAALPMPPDALYACVQKLHSLTGLIDKMDEYIRAGT